MERERKDREAAEQRNQALAKANRKAKQRITIGATVLGLALLGAVASGILARNQVAQAERQTQEAQKREIVANQRATAAQKKEKTAIENNKKMQKSAEEAQQKLQQAQARATDAQKREGQLKQKAAEAQKKLASAQVEAQSAQQQTQKAQRERTKAQEIAKAAKLKVEELRQQEQRANQELSRAKSDLQLAQTKEREAQSNLENARKREQEARQQLAQAETARTKVENDINNVSQLSQLAAQLQKQGLSSEANEAWNQASRVPDIRDDKLKQAMLFASISLASQQLGQQYKQLEKQDEAKQQWNEAENKLQESLNNLAQLSSQVQYDDPNDWATRVHVMRIKGSLLNKQDKTEEALVAYTKAFDTLKKAWSKLPKVDIDTEIPIYQFLPDQQKILSANVVENLHREFIDLLTQTSKQANQQKITEVKESLQAHLFAELNYLMKVNNWKDADIKTTELMLYIEGREENLSGLPLLPLIENLSCPALRSTDKLWVKYSNGKFGFSVQKRIFDSFLEQPGHYDTIERETWLEFASRVGWLRVDRHSDLIFNLIKAEAGHLPSILPRRWVGDWIPVFQDGWGRVNIGIHPIYSHSMAGGAKQLVECNI